MGLSLEEKLNVKRKLKEKSKETVYEDAKYIRGDKGPRGEPGENGVDGVPGRPGKDGQPGIDGRDGKDGRDGIDGRDGKDGERGPRGLTGEPGEDGKAGPRGLPGKNGEKGDKGDKGDPGERGQRGLKGASGGNGARGVGLEYEQDVVYREGMVVSYNAVLWVALSDVPTGVVPEDGSEYWQRRFVDLKDDEWHYVGEEGEPPFLNGWINYTGLSNARFRKDLTGTVHLDGMIKSGTDGSVAFVLPEEYRPQIQSSSTSESVYILLDCISADAQGRIGISRAGNVSIHTISSPTWVSLDGISYNVGPQDIEAIAGPKGDPGIAVLWNSTFSYSIDAIVSYGETIYKSKISNNLGNVPSADSSMWEKAYLSSQGEMRCAHFTLTKPKGEYSGSVAVGINTVPLNTEEYNDIPGCVFDADLHTFSLPPGKYKIDARTEIFYTDGASGFLWNETLASLAMSGKPTFADQGGAPYFIGEVNAKGILPVAGDHVFAFKISAAVARANDGYGWVAQGNGTTPSVFASLMITDLRGLVGDKGDKGDKGDPGDFNENENYVYNHLHIGNADKTKYITLTFNEATASLDYTFESS